MLSPYPYFILLLAMHSPLHGRTAFHLSIHQLMGIRVLSTF